MSFLGRAASLRSRRAIRSITRYRGWFRYYPSRKKDFFVAFTIKNRIRKNAVFVAFLHTTFYYLNFVSAKNKIIRRFFLTKNQDQCNRMNTQTNTLLNTSHAVNVTVEIHPLTYILLAIVGALFILLAKLL